MGTKKTENIHLKVEESFYKRVKEKAEQEQRSLADMVRQMCRRYLENPRNLTNKQKAWLEIFTEFENKGEDATETARSAIYRALKLVKVDAENIHKRYR